MLVDGQAQRRAPLLEEKIAVAGCHRGPHLFMLRIPQGVQPLEPRTPTRRAPPVESLAPAEASASEDRPDMGLSTGASLRPMPSEKGPDARHSGFSSSYPALWPSDQGAGTSG